MKVDEKLLKVEKVTFKSCLFPGPDFRPYHPFISGLKGKGRGRKRA